MAAIEFGNNMVLATDAATVQKKICIVRIVVSVLCSVRASLTKARACTSNVSLENRETRGYDDPQ